MRVRVERSPCRRRSRGWNIHGVLSRDWSVQWAMPKGYAAMGSVLPREKMGVESVPWNRLTSETGLATVAAAGEAFWPVASGVEASTVAPGRITAPAARPEDLRKFRRFTDSRGLEGLATFDCISVLDSFAWIDNSV